MIAASLNRDPAADMCKRSAIGRFDDGHLTIFADARIDDRASLLAQLGILRPIDDAALILNAYRRWGADCAQHLIGDYAFVIVDRQSRRLFCARDHIGARPFFYALSEGFLHFASTVEAVVAACPALGELDDAYAATILVDNGFCSNNRTFFKEVRKLAPGHSLDIGPKTHIGTRFWPPRNIAPLKMRSDEEYVEAARSVFAVAVEDRLGSAERVAVHLSGGLDSSAVAATATQSLRLAGRDDPLGYAWHLRNPENPADDETLWTETARSALNLTAFAPSVEKDALVALLRSDWCLGPNAGNLIHEHAIQNHAHSRSVDLILSGWGGDETLSFNGRGYRAQLLTSGRWAELAKLSNGTGPAALARGIRNGLMEMQNPSKSKALQHKVETSYLAREFSASAGQIERPPFSYRSPQDAMASLIETGSLTVRLEDWAITGQRKGIQYAYPLLDRRVMEFALSLPGHLFLRKGSRRWIMREMLDPIIPGLIRHNTVKREPARAQAMAAIIHRAFMDCADLLEARSTAGHRDHYIDVKRLITDLRGSQETTMTNFSQKRRALQFLQF